MCRVPRGSRGGEAAGDLSMGLVVEVRDGFPEETMSQLILPSRSLYVVRHWTRRNDYSYFREKKSWDFWHSKETQRPSISFPNFIDT